MDQNVESYPVHGVCPHDCYDTCGLELTVSGNRVVKIQGDHNHPVTRGFACLKVNRYLQRLSHEDRILYPLRRQGPKGSGLFIRSSWDEAMADIGFRLGQIVRNFGGEAILPYSYSGNMGVLSEASMDRRFFHRIGASRLARTICSASADAALKWVYGSRIGPDPEMIPQTRRIVLWGSNPVATNLHEIPLLDQAVAGGAKVIVIDPVKTETAARYGTYIAVNPGSDAMLAMGIGRYWLRESLFDADFVADYGSGLEQYREAVEPWTLSRTEQATGLTQSVIENLAHELIRVPPLLIRTGYGVQRHRYGAQAIWAISALSILSGSYRHSGGGHLLGNGDAFPINWKVLTRPDLLQGTPREINMLQLGRALSPDLNPPVKALIVYNANPAATAPDQSAVLEGLSREDLLTVVHEQMMTDTARYADWVLPAAMFPEILDLHLSYWHRYIQLNHKAVEAQGEAVSNTEFFRRLAKAVGYGGEGWAKDSDETLVRQALQTSSPWLEGISWESLQRNPVQKVNISPQFRPFIDFNIPLHALRLEPLPIADSQKVKENPVNFHSEGVGFRLLTPSRKNTIKSSFGNITSLLAHEAEPTVYMHVQDMSSLHLKDGDEVLLSNTQGSARFIVQASERVSAGLLLSYAVRWNRDKDGVNVNQLTSQELSDYGGGSTFYDAWVRVEACRREEPS